MQSPVSRLLPRHFRKTIKNMHFLDRKDDGIWAPKEMDDDTLLIRSARRSRQRGGLVSRLFFGTEFSEKGPTSPYSDDMDTLRDLLIYVYRESRGVAEGNTTFSVRDLVDRLQQLHRAHFDCAPTRRDINDASELRNEPSVVYSTTTKLEQKGDWRLFVDKSNARTNGSRGTETVREYVPCSRHSTTRQKSLAIGQLLR